MLKGRWLSTFILCLVFVTGNVIAEDNVVLAYVNEDVITREQVQQLQDELGVDATKALEAMIEQKLLLQDFYGKKGRILEAHVDAQMDAIIHRNFRGNRNALVQFLHDNGRSLGGLKEEVRVSIISNVMQDQKLESKFAISPKKTREYYEQHKDLFRIPASYFIQQLGFKANSTITIEDNTITKLECLKNFEKIGKSREFIKQQLNEFSSEPAWYSSEELNPDLVKFLDAMRMGEETDYLKMDDLYVVSKLLDKKPEIFKPLSEVQSNIEQVLLKEINDKHFKEYVDFLRSKASISYK